MCSLIKALREAAEFAALRHSRAFEGPAIFADRHKIMVRCPEAPIVKSYEGLLCCVVLYGYIRCCLQQIRTYKQA